MPRWLYLRDNQEFGPLTEKAMRDLLLRKRMQLDTLVRVFDDIEPEKDTPWQRISETSLSVALTELGAETAAEPTAPVAALPSVTTQTEPGQQLRMPFFCTFACVLAAATLVAQMVYIIYRLVTGTPLDPSLAVKGTPVEVWGALCLAAYLLVVILWQATTSDVPSLYGAEVADYTPAHAVLWLVPVLNLYHAHYAMNEIWTFSKDPRAWTRNGVRGNGVTRFWWLTLVGAAALSVVELIVRRNLGKSLMDGMTHWQSILVHISFARTLLWILHLSVFVFLIQAIYRRQIAALNNPPVKRMGRRSEKL